MWTRLLADDQAVPLVRWRLARCLLRHATLLSSMGRGEEAENTLERGDNVCRTRGSSGPPPITRVDREWVRIKNQLGLSCLNTGRWAHAMREFDSAAEAQNRLIQEPGATALDEESLISVLVNQAKAYSAAKEPEAACSKIGRHETCGESECQASVDRTLPRRGGHADRTRSGRSARRLAWSGAGPRAVRASCRHPRITCGRHTAEPGYLEKLADSCGMLAEMYLATCTRTQRPRTLSARSSRTSCG